MFKNFIPKDQLIKKYEEQKGYRLNNNIINQNSSKINNSISRNNKSPNQIEESKKDFKSQPGEKQMEIIYES